MSECTIPPSYDDTTYDDTTYDDTTGYDSLSIDTDGDGFAETTMFDLDADGVADGYDWIDVRTGAEVLAVDTDADGLIDTIVSDDDGDGTFDQASMDTDGDGVLDTSFDPNTGVSDPFEDTPANDPADPSVDDDVHGDPMAEIPYHQAQAGPNDCLPTSVAMVLTEVTGTDVPATDVVDLANELDLLGPDGMSLEGGVALLEHYGVDATVETGTVDELRTMLDAGTPVIIGLDADDLYGTGDEPFADDLVSGHAVVITGIDDEAGLVYVNDPAFPDGAGVAIAIEDFEDAWADADNTMIVADNATTDIATAEDTVTDTSTDAMLTAATDGADAAGDGFGERMIALVMLPIKLVVR